MMRLLILALGGVVPGFSEQGSGWDPSGLQADTGAGVDPNGVTEQGSGLDPLG